MPTLNDLEKQLSDLRKQQKALATQIRQARVAQKEADAAEKRYVPPFAEVKEAEYQVRNHEKRRKLGKLKLRFNQDLKLAEMDLNDKLVHEYPSGNVLFEVIISVDSYDKHYKRTVDQSRREIFELKNPTEKKVEARARELIQTDIERFNSFGYEAEFAGYEVVSFKVVPPHTNIRDMKNWGFQQLAYKLCPQDALINKNEGCCVVDYITWAMRNKFKKFDRQTLVAFFRREAGISVREIMNWVATRKDVSCYAIDPFRQVMMSHVAHNTKIVLSFIVNDQHIYPITDPDLKQGISKRGILQLEEVKFSVLSYAEHEYWDMDMTTKMPSSKIVICSTNDLCALANRVVAETENQIIHMSFTRAELTYFKHPLTEQIFVAGPDYNERKSILSKLFSENNYIGYRFVLELIT